MSNLEARPGSTYYTVEFGSDGVPHIGSEQQTGSDVDTTPSPSESAQVHVQAEPSRDRQSKADQDPQVIEHIFKKKASLTAKLGLLAASSAIAIGAYAGYQLIDSSRGEGQPLPEGAEIIEHQVAGPFGQALPIINNYYRRADTGPNLVEIGLEAAEKSGQAGHGYQDYSFEVERTWFGPNTWNHWVERPVSGFITRNTPDAIQLNPGEKWDRLIDMAVGVEGTAISRASRDGVSVDIDIEQRDYTASDLSAAEVPSNTETTRDVAVVSITVGEAEIMDMFIRRPGNGEDPVRVLDITRRGANDIRAGRHDGPDTLGLAFDGHEEASEIYLNNHAGFLIAAAACDAADNTAAPIAEAYRAIDVPFEFQMNIAPAISHYYFNELQRQRQSVDSGFVGPIGVEGTFTEQIQDRLARYPSDCRALGSQADMVDLLEQEEAVTASGTFSGMDGLISQLQASQQAERSTSEDDASDGEIDQLSTIVLEDQDLGNLRLPNVYVYED